MKGYNFAYLDEQTKRMIRRALLKAKAIPGHQVPFGSREMPLPCGWGTGGIQVTASVLGAGDVLKVIDKILKPDTTNSVSIRQFFARTRRCIADSTTQTADATVIQTRHRIPEKTLRKTDHRLSMPQPEPLYRLEPSRVKTTAHAWARRLRSHACEALRGHCPVWSILDQLRLPGNGKPPSPDVAEPNSRI